MKLFSQLQEDYQKLYRQGLIDESLSIAWQAFRAAKREFGPTHPNILEVLNHLIHVYRIKKRPALMTCLLMRVLTIEEKIYGPKHSAVAITLNNIARMLNLQKRHEEAKPFFQRAIEIFEQYQDLEGRSALAQTLVELADLERIRQRWTEAAVFYEWSLQIFQQVPTAKSRYLMGILGNLSSVYCALERYPDAQRCLQSALAIAEQSLGVEHPETVRIWRNLGLLAVSGIRLPAHFFA